MTPSEVTAFAQKVEDWGRGLTPREQEFLAEIIARAASAEAPDVQGFSVNLNSSRSNIYRDSPLEPSVVQTPAPPLNLGGLTASFNQIVQIVGP